MRNICRVPILLLGGLTASTALASHLETIASTAPASDPVAAAGTGDGTAAKLSAEAARVAIPARLEDFVAQLLSERSSVLDIKRIEPDAAGRKAGWAVDYAWSTGNEQSRVGPDSDGNYSIDKLDYRLDIDGSYAFSDAKNNKNLSTATAAVRLERGNLGKVTVNEIALNKAFFTCLQKLPQVTDDAEERRRSDELLDECIRAGGIHRLVEKEPGGYYYSLDFHGGAEGNQDYSDSNILFGLTTALASQPSRDSSRLNLPDWPFRLLRSGFGQSSNYVAPFPSVKLKAERVDASSDTQRELLTPKTTFTRAEGEVAFNTVVANFAGRLLRFTLSYRYFHEFSPPLAIEQRGMDEFDFVSTSLRFPATLLPFIESDDYELFVAYTSGQLPFDQTDEKAIEVGFSTNLKMLGDLLSR